MVLREPDHDDGTLGVGNRLFEREYRFARLIAEAGAGVDSPRSFILPINGVFNGANHAPISTLVIVDGLKRGLWWVDVRGSFGDLNFRYLVRCVIWSGFHFEFR